MKPLLLIAILSLPLLPLAASGADGPPPIEKVDTPRLIELLETADLKYIGTTHSQSIDIATKDGKRYHGKYVAKDGKYPKITDALNLVIHIVRDKRKLKDVGIMAE